MQIINHWPELELPENVKTAQMNHLLKLLQTEAEAKKSIGEKTKCLLWVGKRLLK